MWFQILVDFLEIFEDLDIGSTLTSTQDANIRVKYYLEYVECIIWIIYTDSHINIACNIATKKIMSHLNVISLYYKYKQNYMGPLFTIYKLKEIIEIARIKKPFSCAYWSLLTQDLLLSSACVSVFSSDK